MNGNWNGISSRYGNEPTHQKLLNSYQDGAEPSMDVINTIVSFLERQQTDPDDNLSISYDDS